MFNDQQIKALTHLYDDIWIFIKPHTVFTVVFFISCQLADVASIWRLIYSLIKSNQDLIWSVLKLASNMQCPVTPPKLMHQANWLDLGKDQRSQVHLQRVPQRVFWSTSYRIETVVSTYEWTLTSSWPGLCLCFALFHIAPCWCFIHTCTFHT